MSLREPRGFYVFSRAQEAAGARPLSINEIYYSQPHIRCILSFFSRRPSSFFFHFHQLGKRRKDAPLFWRTRANFCRFYFDAIFCTGETFLLRAAFMSMLKVKSLKQKNSFACISERNILYITLLKIICSKRKIYYIYPKDA